MDDQNNAIAAPLAKFISVWAMVGITSWADAAAFAAFLWSTLLCCEWMYVKIVRPVLVSRGYMKPRKDSSVTDDPIND